MQSCTFMYIYNTIGLHCVILRLQKVIIIKLVNVAEGVSKTEAVVSVKLISFYLPTALANNRSLFFSLLFRKL